MKQAIAWKIDPDGKPKRLAPGYIDLEKHLEDWVCGDPSIVADDVMLIGRQVTTARGTTLDLLGIDTDGNLVIIELKRSQTLRETIAQALEYAAWAARLGYDEVIELGASFWQGREQFIESFERQFEAALPESVNAIQRILVVAPTIDDATSEIIDYLATTYRMPINAVSFDVFGQPGDQTLVRHFVRESDQVAVAPPGAKARQTRTLEEVLQVAADLGVREIAEPLIELSDAFELPPAVNKKGWTYYPPIGHDQQGHAAISVLLSHYKVPPETVGLGIKPDHLAATLGKPVAACQAFLDSIPGGPQGTVLREATLFLVKNPEAASSVVAAMMELVAAPGETEADAVEGVE